MWVGVWVGVWVRGVWVKVCVGRCVEEGRYVGEGVFVGDGVCW